MSVAFMSSRAQFSSTEEPLYILHDSEEWAKLHKLRSVSEMVDIYLSEKHYLLKYDEDEFDGTTLLYEAYGIILEELQDIGIKIDASVYLSDGYLADKMVTLYQFFKVDNLEKLFTYNDCIREITYDYVTRIYPRLQDHQQYIIESNIAEDIISLLETCKVPFPVDPSELYYIVQDTVNSCNAAIMMNYIRIIIDAIEQKKLLEVDLPDTSLVSAYIQKIKQGREYFKIAINKINTKYPVKTPIVELEIRKYDLTKIQPNVIKYYITLDKEEYERNPKLISEQFRPYYEKYIINEHHKKEPHHYEYWENISRQIGGITDLDIIAMLVSHYYDPDKTEQQVLQQLQPIYTVIHPEQHEVVKSMVQLLYT